MLDVWTANDWALHIYRDQVLCGSLGLILVPMSSIILIMLWWLNIAMENSPWNSLK